MTTKFRQMISSARELKKLSLTHMAKKLDVSTVYYREVENGEKPPFPPAGKVDYAKLAKLLGLKKSDLIKASGRDLDEGAAELREMIRRAEEGLEECLRPSIRDAYNGGNEKGLLALVELVTGRPVP